MNTEIYVIYQDWNGTKPQKHAEEIQQPENWESQKHVTQIQRRYWDKDTQHGMWWMLLSLAPHSAMREFLVQKASVGITKRGYKM